MERTLLLLLLSLPCVHCVLPTGILSLDLLPQSTRESPSLAQQFCSPSATAGWGVTLPTRSDSRWTALVQLPEGNRDGCMSYKLYENTTRSTHDAVVVVDRGNCSFVAKAVMAQAAGAKGLIVRGTKQAVYEAIVDHNSTNSSTNRLNSIGIENAETEATTALSGIDKPVFEYDCDRGQAFVDELATPVWETDAKQCQSDPRCSSKSCVLTGQTTMQKSGKKYQVCCMWDTFVLMGVANRTVAKTLTIPVVYVTIANGQSLQKAMDEYTTSLIARTYQREVPVVDVSSILLWALGVATALGASYYSAYPLRHRDDYHASYNRQKLHDEREERDRDTRDEVWELDARHAVGFIALAGTFLVVFYYVKIGGVIPVLYAMSGAATMTQVITMPAVEKSMPSSAACKVSVPLVSDTVRLSELLGLLFGCTLAIVWFLHRRSCWVLQDIMGICLCFVFLRAVQLPNLKVATVFLILAFCYDVFFVFLSPIFFGSSVMEDVATGGPPAYTKSGYPGVDYCERYPQYPACVDPESLPMLLVLPRIFDWTGGISMLGLGDIILPGMLLSFTLRFDYLQGTTYFRLMAIAYAVGLALANLAVIITKMGQPALMYIVPTTLGAIILQSIGNGDFHTMWVGAEDDTKRDGSEDPGYQVVAQEEGIVIEDRIGRNPNRGDHLPLLSSSSS